MGEKNGTNIEIKLKIAPTDEKDETDGSIVDKINEMKQKQQEIEVAKESIMSELEGEKKVALEEAVPDSSKEKKSDESNLQIFLLLLNLQRKRRVKILQRVKILLRKRRVKILRRKRRIKIQTKLQILLTHRRILQ